MEVYEDIHARAHYLGEELSRGGQGAVFRTRDPDIALKLELKGTEPVMDPSGNGKYQALRLLPVPPGLHITMPRAPLREAAGYIMDLLADMISSEKAFMRLPEQVPENRWIDETFATPGMEALKEAYLLYFATGGARRRLEAYSQAAAIVAKLHENGLVYCDFNPNNLFVSSLEEGDFTRPPEVWLIDADNLGFREEIMRGGRGAYTPTYCAPEIARGEFSLYSDCYSFAVMLFEQLTMVHPFKGEMYHNCDMDWSEGSEDGLIDAGQLAFIWEEGGGNPAREPLATEYFVPDGLRELFVRTFSQQGRMEPKSRPAMPEWAAELCRALDQTVVCSGCGMAFTAGGDTVCPWCDAKLTLLEVECFAGRERARIWRLCRELREGQEISVPARAVGGYAAGEGEAFRVTAAGDRLLLSHFSGRFRFELPEGGGYTQVSGTIECRGGTALRARQDGFVTRIEVRVV